jgi:small subunit ribosomal protein S3
MGRKVHPIGFRLNINKPWLGRWFASREQYVDQLQQDLAIRKVIHSFDDRAGVSDIEVERFPGKVKIVMHTAKPGILIGRKGENVKIIRKRLEDLTAKKIDLEIKEIKDPDVDAFLVAENIAGQLQRRVSYRRALKRALQQAIRQGAQGIKVEVAGRLSGAEMARSFWMREGQVPLQTLRADIDFAKTVAQTTYGIIGIKVWVYKGTVLKEREEKVESTEGVYVSE